jgi:competence protein ComEC
LRNNKSANVVVWKLSPFFRILIPFIGGLLVENYFSISLFYLIPVCLSGVLFVFLYNTIPFLQLVRLEWIPGFAIQLVFFSFGRILVHSHQDILIEDSTVYAKTASNCLLIQVLSNPLPKPKSLKCIARVKWLVKDQSCIRENEKVILYIPKKLDPGQLSAGSYIIIQKRLQPISNSGDFDFDYRRYCRLRHIYAQVFLKETEFSILRHPRENSIVSMLETIRQKILIIIKKKIPSKSESGLLEALMVGFTDDLDPELMKSYADSGVIHFIAISGLHLALICHIIQILLKGKSRKKTINWLKLICILIVLWGYSFLCGASPSVIRSAMMFSLVLFGRNLLRQSVFYNTLAASAFLLLCFDPNWIWDTGFQLSYAAVLSLSLFSKPVKDLLRVKNKILLSLWNAGSVSIAAQILTTPLCIFYFHRFPSYFLFANLLAVPLSSGILVGGILLSLFSWIQPAGDLLGWLLETGIRILNGTINRISHLPGAVISPLTLSAPELFLCYVVVLCFYQFLRRKENKWLISGMVSICCFQFLRLLIR